MQCRKQMSTDKNLMAGRRILLVEDEYLIAEEMASALKANGADVLGPVPCVEDALHLVATTRDLDGAVLDVNLQGEFAYPIADALQHRGIPIVFVTGYDYVSIPEWYRQVSRREKPVDAIAIADALFGESNAVVELG